MPGRKRSWIDTRLVRCPVQPQWDTDDDEGEPTDVARAQEVRRRWGTLRAALSRSQLLRAVIVGLADRASASMPPSTPLEAGPDGKGVRSRLA